MTSLQRLNEATKKANAERNQRAAQITEAAITGAKAERATQRSEDPSLFREAYLQPPDRNTMTPWGASVEPKAPIDGYGEQLPPIEHTPANTSMPPPAPAYTPISALQKIIAMNRQHAEDQYGDAEKAEGWSCVKVARQALAVDKIQLPFVVGTSSEGAPMAVQRTQPATVTAPSQPPSYSLSTDYALLYRLICAGMEVAAWVDYSFTNSDHVNRDIVSVRRKEAWRINIGIRGRSYGSVYNDNTGGITEKDMLIGICEMLNLQFIPIADFVELAVKSWDAGYAKALDEDAESLETHIANLGAPVIMPVDVVQVASEAWDACLKYHTTMNGAVTREQYLNSLKP